MRFHYEDNSPPPRGAWAEFFSDVIIMVMLTALFAAIVFGVASL